MALMVNGREVDWGQVEIGIADCPQTLKDHIIGIEYEDKENVKPRYGRGNVPIGWTKGRFDGNGKLTLTATGFQILMDWVRGKGKERVSQIPPFPIVITYLDDETNVMMKDTIPSVKLDNPKTKANEGDEKIDVEISFIILQPIKWREKV